MDMEIIWLRSRGKAKEEEHLFSTQLTSEEKRSCREVNGFEGGGPEWLIPEMNMEENRDLRGREGKKPIGACP